MRGLCFESTDERTFILQRVEGGRAGTMGELESRGTDRQAALWQPFCKLLQLIFTRRLRVMVFAGYTGT
jgi:hypothetical protein